MIRFYFLALFAGIVVSCSNSAETTLDVHMEGIQLSTEAFVLTQDSAYRLTFDSTNTAKVVFAANLQPGYATLAYGHFNLPVYIEPDTKSEVTLNVEKFKAGQTGMSRGGFSVIPSYSGDGAKKNEYLSKTMERFIPDFKLDETAFINSLDARLAQLNKILDSMRFDETFNRLEKKRLNYVVYTWLPNYPSYHTYYSQDKEYKPSDVFYGKLKSVIQEDESLISLEEYKRAMEGAIGIYAAKDEVYDPLIYLKNQLDYIQENIKSPLIAEYFVDLLVTGHVEKSGIDALDEIAPVYNAKVNDPVKKANFRILCTKWEKVAKGQPAPDFNYLDINGKKVGLAGLAGKYVYIDVWATWCGPCRGELPYLKELEHQFKDKNIHFVSISCDQDKAAWQNTVKSEQLGGIQLHCGDDRSFLEVFMIRSIPRFILLDREGKILVADMSRPSQTKTAEMLSGLEGI